jgi:hypothetical protein
LYETPGNHDLADKSTRRTLTRPDAELFGVHEEDIQVFVRADERTDERTVVIRKYSKSGAKDTLEILNCLCISHIQKAMLCVCV